MSAHKFFTHTCRKCELTFRLLLRPDRRDRLMVRCPDCHTKVWFDNRDGGLTLRRTRMLSRPIREYELVAGVDYVPAPPELAEPAPTTGAALTDVPEAADPTTDQPGAASTPAAGTASVATAKAPAPQTAVDPEQESPPATGRLRLTLKERMGLWSDGLLSQAYLLRYRTGTAHQKVRTATGAALDALTGTARRAATGLGTGLRICGRLLLWPLHGARQIGRFLAGTAAQACAVAQSRAVTAQLAWRSLGLRLRHTLASWQAQLQDWQHRRALAAAAARTQKQARLQARAEARLEEQRSLEIERAARAARAELAASEARAVEQAPTLAAPEPVSSQETPAPPEAVVPVGLLASATEIETQEPEAIGSSDSFSERARCQVYSLLRSPAGFGQRLRQSFQNGRLRWLWPQSVSPRLLIAGYAAAPAVLFALYLVASFAFFPGLALPESMAVFEARLQPVQANRIVDRDGGLIAELFTSKTSSLELQPDGSLDPRVPDSLRRMLLFVEDGSFYKHAGIRPLAILRAFGRNVLAGRYVEGGSTITQQVARMALRRRDRSLRRKFQEAVLSRQLEVELSKNEILNAYLNHVYMGHGAYGMQLAAEFFFQRPLNQLNFSEQLMLVTLLPAPAEYSPLRNPARLEERMDLLYARMVTEDFPRVAADHYRRQKNELFASVADLSPNQSVFASRTNQAPYVTEYVRLALKDLARAYERRISAPETARNMNVFAAGLHTGSRAAESDNQSPAFDRLPRFRLSADLSKNEFRRRAALLATGATVETTIDPMLQRAATVETPRFISEVNPRFPARQIVDGKAVRPSGLRAALGRAYEESRLGLEVLGYQAPPVPVPRLQAAAIGVRPSTGAVLFMQGGAGFRAGNQLNHAIAMRRQTGSAIKPFIYAAAIASGRAHPATILEDRPYPKEGPGPEEDPEWKPRNYKDDYHGKVSVRFALEQSLNIPTIRLAERTGMDRIARQFRRVFFPSESSFQKRFRRDLTVAIGSLEMSPLEMAVAYSAFGNNGRISRPYLITRVTARDGTVLFERPEPAVTLADSVSPANANSARAAARPSGTGKLSPETTGDEFGLRIPGERQVMSGDVAHVMASLLKDSAKRGGAGYWSRFTLGKTGTSNHYRDAWFVGVLPDVSAAVWVGYDQPSNSMGRATGAAVAGPLWARIIASGMYGRSPGEFHFAPRGRYFTICTKSGGRARASCPHTRREIFARRHVPGKCRQHKH